MTREELNRVLDLQNKAYNLLLWIDDQARHQPDLLSEKNIEAWRSVASCKDWIRRMIGTVPRDLRPEENDIAAFSHLVSSFFNTSFRVDNVQQSAYVHEKHFEAWQVIGHVRKLVPGAPALANKTPAERKRIRQKGEESARHLQLIALEELAIENDVDLSREQLETLAQQSEIQDALNLYSYAHELVRRSEFASQGAAVHALWNTMDKKTRQKLSTEVIWQARESLLEAVRAVAR